MTPEQNPEILLDSFRAWRRAQFKVKHHFGCLLDINEVQLQGTLALSLGSYTASGSIIVPVKLWRFPEERTMLRNNESILGSPKNIREIMTTLTDDPFEVESNGTVVCGDVAAVFVNTKTSSYLRFLAYDTKDVQLTERGTTRLITDACALADKIQSNLVTQFESVSISPSKFK